VYSFEFIDSNIQIFNRNLDLNPDLRSRVELVRHPMWSRSGVPMLVTDRGPASNVRLLDEGSEEEGTVQTVTIDDLWIRSQLSRVDFIKMDIEGAELEALKGAEQTIRRFRPKLAICLYHRPEDFVTIPRFLDQTLPEYRFAIGHFTIHAEETVLYAWLPTNSSADGAPRQT
jgi:FkbM family methyltransferase